MEHQPHEIKCISHKTLRAIPILLNTESRHVLLCEQTTCGKPGTYFNTCIL